MRVRISGSGEGQHVLKRTRHHAAGARIRTCACERILSTMRMHVYVCMYVYVCICMHACMFVCACISVHICKHVCMYACIYICMYVCMMNSCVCVSAYAHGSG